MKVDARTEEFQHIELFDKFALFTNARIDRSNVPKGWYCYDIRGSDDDPAVRKAVDDVVFDLYGEENPCQQADYEPQPEQDMTMGGM